MSYFISFKIETETYNALEGDFEGTNSGEDLVSLLVCVIIRNQLAVYLKIYPWLGDLIYENNGAWSEILDFLCH